MYGGDDAKNYSIWHGNVAQEEKKERNHCNDPFNSYNLDHQLDIITELLGLGRGQIFLPYLCLILLNKQLLLSFLLNRIIFFTHAL